MLNRWSGNQKSEMKTLIENQPITFETALTIVDATVFSQVSRHLKNIEIEVLRGAWYGKTYDDIALESGYAPEYIKHDVGPKLWKILSASFGEKVSKTSLIALLTSKAQANLPLSQQFSPLAATATPSQSLDGPIPLSSAFYIERPAVETRCYTEITKSGVLIRIKAPAQMGKTSLMVRILAAAKEVSSEVATVALNLQQADRAVFQDLDQFLRWFCAAITRKLQLPYQVSDYWSETFGSKSNCTAYFEDCILPHLNSKFILALDKVDEVFAHPEIADDFFSLLRSWYEEASYGESGNPLWQNLCLIIVHSTDVYIPLDINKSPFNVGLPIELEPFNYSQAIALAQRYQLNLTEAECQSLMALIAGHPYLLQQAFFHLSQGLDLSQFLETATTDAGIYGHHLHRHLELLQAHPALLKAYQDVVHSAAPVELEQAVAFKLQSLALVKFQGNCVLPSCQLYQAYFRDRV